MEKKTIQVDESDKKSSSDSDPNIQDVEQIESDQEDLNHTNSHDHKDVGTKENSEDLNNEGSGLIESENEEKGNDSNDILNTDMDLRESEINQRTTSAQQKIHKKIQERETMMRESQKPEEGFGRQSYNMQSMISSNIGLQKKKKN